ncbi:MAG TPA: ankyrin repeat domain-containing protein [Micavibrio sp.]
MPTFTQEDLNEQLRQAARDGDAGKIRLLVMGGADVDARDADGWNAFHLATAHGHHSVATTLLAARQLSYIRQIGIDAQDFYEAPVQRRVA